MPSKSSSPKRQPATKTNAKPSPAKAKKPAASSPAKPTRTAAAKPAAPAKKSTKITASAPAKSKAAKPLKVSATFLKKQKARLLGLKDSLLDSMNGVARDSLRSRAEGSEASAFGMHQADAGSDAYDRDFALSLLSQEHDSLYEIDEALKRIEDGTYGVCEMSGQPIPHARLEALPFTRFTVECQAQLEKQSHHRGIRHSVSSLFGLSDDDSSDDRDDDSSDSKD